MSEYDKKAIGNRIKKRLKELGKTQAWLAEQAHMQTGLMSELLNGNPRRRWNMDHLNAIALALNTDLSALAGEEEISQEAAKYDAFRNRLEEKQKQEWDAMIELQMKLFGKD